jgi:hypothetical protein
VRPVIKAIGTHVLPAPHLEPLAPTCRPAGSSSRWKELLIEPHLLALADTIPSCYWLDRPDSPHLALDFVRKRAFPWPPEPIRSIGVGLTQRALARADETEGRRGPWLRTLDFLGLGFDS